MMTCPNKLEIKSLLLLMSPTNICEEKTIKLVQGSHITLDVYYLSFAASHSLPMSHAWHSLQLVHRVSPPPLDWIDNKCSKASSSARHSSQMQLQLQLTITTVLRCPSYPAHRSPLSSGQDSHSPHPRRRLRSCSILCPLLSFCLSHYYHHFAGISDHTWLVEKSECRKVNKYITWEPTPFFSFLDFVNGTS